MAIQAGDVVWNVTALTAEFEKGLDKAQSRADRLAGSLQKHSKAIGVGLTAAGGAITGTLAIAAKQAISFQSELATLNTLGVDNLESLGDTVKDVSRSFGLDLVESTTAAYNAISAGVDEKAIPSFLELAATAATAGKSTLDTAVQLGAGVTNAFGKTADEVETVFDQAFIAVKSGVTTFEELAASVGEVAPAFAAAQLGSDQMFASISALTKGGVQTNKAVTQMKAVMNSIIKPTSQLDALFEDMGGAMAAVQEIGLAEFMAEVQERTQGNVSEMGKLFSSTEALSAALALGGTQADSFAQILAQMEDGAGATVKAFDAMVDADPAFAFKQLRSEISVLAVEVGSALLPVLKRIVEAIRPVISAIVDWLSNNRELAAAIITLGGVFGGIMTILGPLLIILPGIATAFTALSAAIGAISAPILGVVALITGALIGAFFLLRPVIFSVVDWFKTNWEQIKSIVANVFAGVKATFMIFFELVKAGFTVVGAVLDGFGAAIANTFGLAQESAQQGATTFLDSLQQMSKSGSATLKEVLAHVRRFGQFINQNWDQISQTTQDFVNFVVNPLIQLGRTFFVVGDTISAAMQGIQSSIARTASFIEGIVQGIISTITRAIAKVTELGAAAGEFFGFQSGGVIGQAHVKGFQSGGTVGSGHIQALQTGGVVRTVAAAGIAAASMVSGVQGLQTGGIVRVGETGPELAALPVGTRVLSAGDARTVAREAQGPGTANINIAGINIGKVERTGDSRKDAERTAENIFPHLVRQLTDAYESADRSV